MKQLIEPSAAALPISTAQTVILNHHQGDMKLTHWE